MPTKSFSLGIDFGTSELRCIVLNLHNGQVVAQGSANYSCGEQGILYDRQNSLVARQDPKAYLESLRQGVLSALKQADLKPEFSRSAVIAIGVDTTGSTPLAVDANNKAIASLPEWNDDLGAMAWLWKDHSAYEEAEKITAWAKQECPEVLERCGGIISSEWFWPKLWKCLKEHPKMMAVSASWVECCDWIPSVLCGINDPHKIVRSICAAGHKAMFDPAWGGFPSLEKLAKLSPELAAYAQKLQSSCANASQLSGHLCPEYANYWGLPEGLPIGVGVLDAHAGAVGSGVRPGALVKIIGTSTCDLAVIPSQTQGVPHITGISGIVPDSILPGMIGLEAGQSAVGDLFAWFIQHICKGDQRMHQQLSQEAILLEPGASGLLALDWNNGNRCILGDSQLSGLILGQTLHTTRAEMYRALVEATAFGAKMILEQIQSGGVNVDTIICSGGIAEKSSFLMQIYADVTGCEMVVSATPQSCAYGSALLATHGSGHLPQLSGAMVKLIPQPQRTYHPDPARMKIYDELYQLYRQLTLAFGGKSPQADMAGLMKKLLALKKSH